jgi:non-ribosomal peptide synthetase-like protein
VEVGRCVTINRGCVVQTHLFHDRLMRLDAVRIGAGATLGPHAIALPETTIGAGTTVGPASLVLRGERLPEHSRWLGNPVSSWASD